MNKRTILVCAFLIVQCLAVGFLIYRYERVVSAGTEVRFKCQAYDPYDPLRGRYLRTTVRERTTNAPEELKVDSHYSNRNKLAARVEPSTNGLWRVAEVAFEPSGEGVWVKPKGLHVRHALSYSDKRKDEDYEAFHKRQEASGYVVDVTFPDQLFVNEKLAPEAEKILRERTADAVAVYRVLDGEIVITDIEIGGKSILKLAK